MIRGWTKDCIPDILKELGKWGDHFGIPSCCQWEVLQRVAHLDYHAYIGQWGGMYWQIDYPTDREEMKRQFLGLQNEMLMRI